MTTEPTGSPPSELTASVAKSDLRQYGRAMLIGSAAAAIAIEKRWGLYGYTPEIVSTVLSCVATGLPIEAAIEEATS